MMDSEQSPRKRPRLPNQQDTGNDSALSATPMTQAPNMECGPDAQQISDPKNDDFSILHPFDSKVFNDPIHGHMEMHPLFVLIIDTPQFQRLRDLKQLGVCYFVYPGASHNRFEHSLGVCHLAGLLVKRLQMRQPELGITVQDILCVQIAGLCHDLGHGPFSHVFDKAFIPQVRKGSTWKHEKASTDMFKHLIKVNNLELEFRKYGLEEEHRDFIMELIIGKPQSKDASDKLTWYYGNESQKSFLYEIVANKRNEVDVDKWDYLRRDCHHLGITSSFDHMRFIQFSRVIRVGKSWQICVRDKEAFNMYEMFHTRHALHRRAYQHKVVQAVEVMLVDAMKKADEYIRIPGDDGTLYKISECIDHMDAYTKLNDSILQVILMDPRHDLQCAQKILQDIQKRKLYKCVGETEPITASGIIKKNRADIEEEILAELEDHSKDIERLKLDTSTFAVQIAKLDFGKEDMNPLQDLCFFSKADPDTAHTLRASEVSSMLPQNLFREHLVRSFLRPSENKEADEERLKLLHKGFERWCKKNHLKNSKLLTPWKPDQPEPGNRTPDRPILQTRNSSSIKVSQYPKY